MGVFIQIVPILVYLAAARFTVRHMRGGCREAVFAGLNLAGYYFLCGDSQDSRYRHLMAVYVLLVLVQFAAMRLFVDKADWRLWIAFFAPILPLIFIRYVPPALFSGMSHSLREATQWNPDFTYAPYFVGLSYLAFRNSHLVLEVRNGIVKKPGLWQYLGFSFFVPTMPVGPINPYNNFRRAFDAAPPAIPAGRAVLRIMVGLVKYKFLGTLCNQLTYAGLLRDEHYHPWIDLPVAVIFYYLYLYCNFSGFCDMAIGAAGLIGIPVAENFNNPFEARNVKDFWNRWHITLSQYMRDVVFSPLSKFLVRIAGPAYANHAIALTIVIVFLLIGVWHGAGWNYAAYGAAHALAVVVNHYYTIALKKWLGRDGFKAYNANPWIRAIAVTLTFCYCAATLFLFANTLPQMKEILSGIRW